LEGKGIKTDLSNNDKIINPIIEKKILNHIVNFLDNTDEAKIYEILNEYEDFSSFSKSEFIYVIRKGLKNNYFNIVKSGNRFEENTINLNKKPNLRDECKIQTVVSTPHLSEISINNFMKRNDLLDLKKCFKKVIKSSKDQIRISSPFIEKNILDENAFPEIKTLIRNTFNNDVNIKIITREIQRKRKNDVDWIIKIAKELNKLQYLEIVDYHIKRNNKIYASTHAKMLIADEYLAYVGSGELRKNSLNVNLEIGCLIEGDMVTGLCEIFDYMFSKGERYV